MTKFEKKKTGLELWKKAVKWKLHDRKVTNVCLAAICFWKT